MNFVSDRLFRQNDGIPSQYIDPRYAPNNNNAYAPPVAQIAQAAQDPNHPANPNHPKVISTHSNSVEVYEDFVFWIADICEYSTGNGLRSWDQNLETQPSLVLEQQPVRIWSILFFNELVAG